MAPIYLLLVGLAIAVALFAIYWVVQYVIKDSGIVDVFWGASVAVVGVFFCVMADGDLTRRWIGAVLICLWAFRLGFYLYLRWRSHEEDARYTALKEKWGDQAQLRMFRFYQMQALGSYLFALPLLVASMHDSPVIWTDWLGVIIWLVAMIGEGFSDHQLAQFRKKPENKGQVCQVGFWKYSRHPNYFFEWLHWWTYVMLAITAPLGWLTILAPIAMWIFLNRVTGIPLTEIQAIKSRGDKYRKYQETTNAFFPWFPKSG
ncbi:MAG: DUF1295 domain-containing protein [Mariniblastus sp.]